MVSQSPRVAASGSQLVDRVLTVKEDLGRLASALEETSTIWRKYLQQLPETEVLPVALDEMQFAFVSSQGMFRRMVDVTTNMKLLDVPILLEGESICNAPMEMCGTDFGRPSR